VASQDTADFLTCLASRVLGGSPLLRPNVVPIQLSEPVLVETDDWHPTAPEEAAPQASVRSADTPVQRPSAAIAPAELGRPRPPAPPVAPQAIPERQRVENNLEGLGSLEPPEVSAAAVPAAPGEQTVDSPLPPSGEAAQSRVERREELRYVSHLVPEYEAPATTGDRTERLLHASPLPAVRPNTPPPRREGFVEGPQLHAQSRLSGTAPDTERPQLSPAEPEPMLQEPAGQHPAMAEEVTVRVSIGRIDLRAVPPAARLEPTPRPAKPRPLLSLDDYLKQRSRRQR
jgi:hypothetical protein